MWLMEKYKYIQVCESQDLCYLVGHSVADIWSFGITITDYNIGQYFRL